MEVIDEADSEPKLTPWESEGISKKAFTTDNTIFVHRAIRPSVRQKDFGEVKAAGQPCTG
ncbi:hypothetical protein EJP77_18685 [Paenibacillus zeisoli]|uniref:Uncharacterized protein n=1 Tax=Paenibacillus zeisoli TaxID=2496267 RepID=A0A3S1B5F0_9BACL|nr:hypothetical protein [Paenibacillus zeisoli]RUT28043.1 hypothetical protein EJP77_18685 [Paenibacillus zeisoli]